MPNANEDTRQPRDSIPLGPSRGRAKMTARRAPRPGPESRPSPGRRLESAKTRAVLLARREAGPQP
eukprot:132025-Pyramimonas_sp.AAC.1